MFWRKRLFLWTVEYWFSQVCPVSWHVSTVHETNTPIVCNTRIALWCVDVGMKSMSFYHRSKLDLIWHCENCSDFSLKNYENWWITQKLMNRFCSIVRQVTLWYQKSHLTKHEANPAFSLGGDSGHTYIHTRRQTEAFLLLII